MIQLKQLNYSTEKRHGEQFIGMCTQSDPGLDPGSNFTCWDPGSSPGWL